MQSPVGIFLDFYVKYSLVGLQGLLILEHIVCI